jgi:hypothetical protein
MAMGHILDQLSFKFIFRYLNVSTLGGRNAKTYLKIEGVTGKRSDIIFMSDMRVGGKKKEIEDIFRMTKNGNYVTYINSSRNARGVGIAI